MGGGTSKNRSKTKIIPQFTVTIVINNEAIVAIDVCEDATLADARKEILLESEEFSNLPTDYYFSRNNAPFSKRKENSHTVRELAGSAACSSKSWETLDLAKLLLASGADCSIENSNGSKPYGFNEDGTLNEDMFSDDEDY